MQLIYIFIHTKINLAVFAIAGVLFLSSCEMKKESLPSSSGMTAEILFVIEKPFWQSIVGDSIKSIFKSDYVLLNQPEPMFKLANIEESDFSKIFKSHHNIVVVDINTKNTSPKLELRKDVWSQPQVVIKLSASDPSGFLYLLSKHKDQIIGFLYENERTRMIKSFRNDAQIEISKTLKEMYGFSLTFPKGYFIATKNKDFCWLRRETEETSIGILLYTYPYTDTLSFNEDYILNLRDSLTRLYIAGPRDGSYMQVSRKVVMPFFKTVDFKDHFAVETRGLWEVKNDFMGGPFINYTFVDEANNRVITLDAFVYAPQEEKKNYMIHAESIIYTYESLENQN